jgi:hypothetical protein
MMAYGLTRTEHTGRSRYRPCPCCPRLDVKKAARKRRRADGKRRVRGER